MKLVSHLLIVLISAIALSACSKVRLPSKDHVPFVYRIDVQQGNVITQEMLAQLELGMDKKKVEFIMGSPIITDTFHSNRWDYIYTYTKGHSRTEQRRVTLFFRDELLAKVEGDVVAASGAIVTEQRRMDSVDVPPAEDPGIFARVKSSLPFTEDDSPDQIKATAEDVLPASSLDGGDVPSAAGETEKAEVQQEAAEQAAELAEEANSEISETEPVKEDEEQGFFGRMWDKVTGGDE